MTTKINTNHQTYWSFIQGVVSEYASIPKKLEIDEEGGYVGLVVGISNTVAQDRFQILSCDAYHMYRIICSIWSSYPLIYRSILYRPYYMISNR